MRRRQVMRHTFVLAVFFAALAVSGCSAQQSNQSLSQTQNRLRGSVAMRSS